MGVRVELHGKVDREDPKALLDGVAVADLPEVVMSGALDDGLATGWGGEEADEGFRSSEPCSPCRGLGAFFLDLTGSFPELLPWALRGGDWVERALLK
ncbi:hypothetical protein NL676_024472 [Syzygium grande]|nr:hypothetical protein NL676_024472 [Syzygium grande]